MADVEEVADRIAYYGEDNRLHRWIVETVARLPEEVCEFACERCRFLSVGRSALGMVIPAGIATHYFEKRTRNMWLILLEEELPEEDAHSIIAHEIAHARLGHDRFTADVPVDSNCRENEGMGVHGAWGRRGGSAQVLEPSANGVSNDARAIAQAYKGMGGLASSKGDLEGALAKHRGKFREGSATG